MPLTIVETTEDVTFGIRVMPRASTSEISGETDGDLRIRISAPPVDGAANKEIVKLLSKTLGVARSNVEIVSGLASRNKRIRITGVTAEQVQKIADG